MHIMLTYLIRSGKFSAVIKRLLESDREYYLSRRTFLSLTELTDLTEPFAHSFELTEGLRHTDITERYS